MGNGAECQKYKANLKRENSGVFVRLTSAANSRTGHQQCAQTNHHQSTVQPTNTALLQPFGAKRDVRIDANGAEHGKQVARYKDRK